MQRYKLGTKCMFVSAYNVPKNEDYLYNSVSNYLFSVIVSGFLYYALAEIS